MTTAEKAREEPLLFFLTLEAANRRCVLSYSTRTADGEAIFPSMFVDEVLRHFHESDDRAAIFTRLPALPSVPPPSGCVEPGELLRRAALAWRAGGIEGSIADQVALDEMLRAQGIMVDWLRQLARIEAMRKRYLLDAAPLEGIDPSPFGDIGRQIDLHRRFLDSQRPWSPTMLEDAATCPFAFFAKHALRLAPRTVPDYDVSPLVLGELAHGILAEFLKTAPPKEAPAAVQRMRVIAERVFAQHIHDPGLGHPGFWMVRKAELVAVLDDLAAYMAVRGADDYRTCYHERDMVGVAASSPWSVWLQGRVDRVAIREGPSGISGILVQDFKDSGNVERYRGLLDLDAFGRLSFQLPVYLQAPVGEVLVDAVIVLEGGWLCIDSKFPLDNFRRMAQPDAEPEARQQWRRLFLGDVRRHVTDIAHKYIVPPATLDFALMFIPAENVYYEVLLSDEVLEFARAKRVVPVSPNTLYAYLQAISIGFRGLKIAQETRRIEQLLLGLKKNFDEFKEHFRLIDRHLDRARGQFIQAKTDVNRFDHTIGGIQFGTLNEELPQREDRGLRQDDSNAKS